MPKCSPSKNPLGLFSDPEDGEDIFIRNVSWLSTEDIHPHNNCCENLGSTSKFLFLLEIERHIQLHKRI
jgi:hypothetical protein